MDPEPNTATLTIDGTTLDEWLRAVIREELEAAVTKALSQLTEILGIGNPAIPNPTDA